jgi:hypothetical protein
LMNVVMSFSCGDRCWLALVGQCDEAHADCGDDLWEGHTVRVGE